jgi:hypothetical protein
MALAGTKVRIQRPRGSDLLRRFVLRLREPGHLRFDLPAELCDDASASMLAAALMRHDGIYRVLTFVRSGKLSIRYDTVVLTEGQIFKILAAAVTALSAKAKAVAPAAASGGWRGIGERLQNLPVARWGREKLRQGRLAARAVQQLALLKSGKPAPLPFDAKEWGIHFINDLVAFYLIRVHWTRITQQWLPNPLAFRYQWLTIIYLTFILVRYRKAALGKVAAK